MFPLSGERSQQVQQLAVKATDKVFEIPISAEVRAKSLALPAIAA